MRECIPHAVPCAARCSLADLPGLRAPAFAVANADECTFIKTNEECLEIDQSMAS